MEVWFPIVPICFSKNCVYITSFLIYFVVLCQHVHNVQILVSILHTYIEQVFPVEFQSENFLFQVTPKTLADVKGGTLISYEDRVQVCDIKLLILFFVLFQ